MFPKTFCKNHPPNVFTLEIFLEYHKQHKCHKPIFYGISHSVAGQKSKGEKYKIVNTLKCMHFVLFIFMLIWAKSLVPVDFCSVTAIVAKKSELWASVFPRLMVQVLQEWRTNWDRSQPQFLLSAPGNGKKKHHWLHLIVSGITPTEDITSNGTMHWTRG